jgi:polar amino acid transport system permease protein
MDTLVTYLQRVMPDLLQGIVTTLYLTVVALTLGVIIGLPAALARVYGPRWLHNLAISYIELFRGTPLLVQLFIVYYGLPAIGSLFGLPHFGITLDRLPAAFVTLGLNSGAYQAEYFRGAIQAVGSGQMTAARALGMTKMQAIIHIILPQALRLAIPAWSNEAVSMIKYTAIVFLIAVPDIMGKAKILAGRYFNPIEIYITVALIYLVLVTIATWLVRMLERRLETPEQQLEVARH